MIKKMLTLEQLFQFCTDQKLYNFNSEETGYKICVQVPSVYEADDDKSSNSMAFAKIKLLHTNRNRNGSNVTLDAAKKCMGSIAYKPLLANFCEIDGVEDFTSHDMILNDDGSINYIEHQIGCFTVDKPYLEYDKDKDRHYLYAYVAIPKEYTHAFDIIERKGGTKVSAELAVNKMSYDAEKKELLLEDIEVMGATCLGTDPETGKEVKEGMEGARLDIQDFSISNDTKMLDMMQELKEALDTYNKNFGKEEVQVENEELLEEVTEEVTEEVVEKMSAEEVVEDVTETEETTEEEVTVEEEFSDDTTDDEVAPEEDTNDEETVEESEEVVEEPVVEQNCLKYSIECGELKKNFSLSLNEKIYALQELINETYSELDNDYFMVDVYDEDKLVVFHGWSGKSYRQSFKCKKDSYSLVGDRIEVYAQYLTQDEIAALENMRSKYAEIETKLSKYEAEPQKMEILNSDDYSQIAETEEFVALKAQDAHFDMSVAELTAKCDEMLLSYAKTQKIEFATKESTTGVSRMGLPTAKKKESRYGNLFSK